MSSDVNAPTTILSPITVSSTENPSLFEQKNDSVHLIKGGRRKSQRRKNKKTKNKKTKRRTSSKRKSVKTTFLGKWMAIGK